MRGPSVARSVLSPITRLYVVSASPRDADQPREAEDQGRHDASDQEPLSRPQPAIKHIPDRAEQQESPHETVADEERRRAAVDTVFDRLCRASEEQFVTHL